LENADKIRESAFPTNLRYLAFPGRILYFDYYLVGNPTEHFTGAHKASIHVARHADAHSKTYFHSLGLDFGFIGEPHCQFKFLALPSAEEIQIFMVWVFGKVAFLPFFDHAIHQKRNFVHVNPSKHNIALGKALALLLIFLLLSAYSNAMPASATAAPQRARRPDCA